jgi:hypothetical protein
MAELGYTVNPDEKEQTFDIVPAGEYIAIIEASDFINNKKGSGQILKLTYQIIDGPKKGARLFEVLNLVNESEQAQNIAKRTLNSIGLAVGISHIKDSEQLHNIPMIIDVRVKGDENSDYGKQNQIKKHLPYGQPKEDKPKTAQDQFPEKPSSGLKGTGKKPWEK